MIHPIGFWGWRVAISAPTVEKLSTMAAKTTAKTEFATTSVITPEAGRNNVSSREGARATMESSYPDQATQAAVRRLMPPIPRLCSVDPSVTSPLYSTIVSQALRQPLRGHAVANFLELRLGEVRGMGPLGRWVPKSEPRGVFYPSLSTVIGPEQ